MILIPGLSVQLIPVLVTAVPFLSVPVIAAPVIAAILIILVFHPVCCFPDCIRADCNDIRIFALYLLQRLFIIRDEKLNAFWYS